MTKTVLDASLANEHVAMSVVTSNIAQTMVATIATLRVATAALATAMAKIASTAALAITSDLANPTIVRIRRVVAISFARTNETVLNINHVNILGRTASTIPIAKRKVRVTTKMTTPALKAVVVILLVHMSLTPVRRKKIISNKVKRKEKSP